MTRFYVMFQSVWMKTDNIEWPSLTPVNVIGVHWWEFNARREKNGKLIRVQLTDNNRLLLDNTLWRWWRRIHFVCFLTLNDRTISNEEFLGLLFVAVNATAIPTMTLVKIWIGIPVGSFGLEYCWRLLEVAS